MKKLKDLLIMVYRLLFGKKTSTQNNYSGEKTYNKTTTLIASSSFTGRKQETDGKAGQAEYINSNVPPKISEKTLNRVNKPVEVEIESEKTGNVGPPFSNPERPPGKTFNIPPENLTSQKTRVARFVESITGRIDESVFYKDYIVNYKPNEKYRQIFPMNFPYVLMPEEGTPIKPPVNGSSANKGMLEAYFCRDYLMKYFSSKVFDSLTLFAGEMPYEPDLAFIDLNTGKNIFIDIEIDEPYDGVGKRPTHYRIEGSQDTVDAKRNQRFTDRGWMVMRFAEQQILDTPLACCRFIAEVIKSIHPGFTSECLFFSEEIKKVNIWTYSEAKLMAASGARENYLNITQFQKYSGTEGIQIKDSYRGKLMEEELRRKSKEKQRNLPFERQSIAQSAVNKINQPVAERNSKENNLRETVHSLQSGEKMISSAGAVSTAKGITSPKHRFHGGIKARTAFPGKKPANCYSTAYIQMLDIMKKFSFLKCNIINDTLICTGTIQLESCNPYKIRIESRADCHPKVYIINHDITPHPDIHMYNDRSLCLYYPGDLKWKTNTSLADHLVPWTFEWILFYELYQLTGIWEGAFVPHENIESFNDICLSNGDYGER